MTHDPMTHDPTTDDPMSPRRSTHQQQVAWLGWAGAVLGVIAGLIQATIGTRIPDWTGAKDDTVALGALTVVLSMIAALAASWLSAPTPLPVPRRIAVVVAFVVPAVLGFTTVGRLWYLPGVMLLIACGLTPTVAHPGARVRHRADDLPRQKMQWSGMGLVFGSGAGMIVGLLLAGGTGIAFGLAIGAAAGLVIGAAVDANSPGP